jgi:GTP-binding protein
MSDPTAPLVAIVGRPNVGKSTLYNRLVGGRPALVHDTPGLTRDRRYGSREYFSRGMRVVDTGGLDPDAEAEVIGAGIHRQAHRAIAEADLILLVVDGTTGLTPLDHAVVEMLRTTGKPVVLAVNKIDSPKRDVMIADFYELGLGEPYPISAAHGRGVDDLLEAMVARLPAPAPTAEAEPGDDDELDDEDAEEEEDTGDEAPGPLRVALVGKPNAGKSSLLNRLVGEERSLVHHAPGTTTDPVDSELTFGGRPYVLVDTAGIRRKARIDADVEKIAVTMAISQIARADVVVLVIDASIGPSEQDARLAGMVAEAGKALVLALNKSDLVHGDAAQAKLRQAMKDNFHFLPWAPITQLSAQRGDGVDRLMDVVDQVAAEHRRRVPTAELNRFFAEVCETTPPPVHKGKAVRIYYLTQGRVRPPTFLLFASAPDGLSPHYRRFVMNQLRKRYGFRGTPLRIVAKAKQTPGTRSKPRKKRS